MFRVLLLPLSSSRLLKNSVCFCKSFHCIFPAFSARMVFEKLPSSVRPVNYKLRIQPDLLKLSFEGEEQIELDVQKSTSTVVVNARDIIVVGATLNPAEDSQKCAVVYENKEEKICFNLGKEIQPGRHVLQINFTGTLNDELRGFYRTRYTTPDKEQRNGALTHFEATGARRAFPCFDEPALRATFDITLVVPKDKVALSNMPVKNECPKEDNADWKVLEFEQTPIMSTYLIAFVVGDFDFAECVDEEGTLIRVYTPLQKAKQGVFAAQVARETMPFYKNYFNVPYPLKKLDLVAAPDFPIGAMENWGLVIYRESALLIDEEKSSILRKNYVALIVGHELAHNWFGNLVTMDWWTHLWLKEGFATWIEYLCVDHCLPEFDVWTQFVNIDLFRALKLDALDNSHPIEIEVGNPGEVDEIFDAISYCKGASIIRMLHDFVGDDDFRKGMTIYLNRHQYKSARTEDLWCALEESSGKQVGKVMTTWTKQKGFPVLMVTEEQSGKSRTLTITQKKFSADPDAKEDTKSLWIVPVSITTQESPNKTVKKELIESRSHTVTIDVPAGQWVKLNAGTKGVYRVQYTTEMLNRFIPGIRDRTLPPTDRLGILSDLFALNGVGLVSSADLLNVVKAFLHENNYTVWQELLTNLSDISLLLQYTDATGDFNKFICSLLGTVFSELGWKDGKTDGEDELVSMLRQLVLLTLGACGDESVKEKTRVVFDGLSESQPQISADMARPVFKTIMKHGSKQDFDKLREMYKNVDSSEMKEIIGSTFGSSSDADVLQQALEFAVSDHVRAQDSPGIIGQISRGSVKGRELAWEFFIANQAMLYKRYESSTMLARIVNMITCNFATEEKAKEIETFFAKHPSSSVTRTVQQSCEKIRLNAQWLKRHGQQIVEYLKQQPSAQQEASGEGKPREKLFSAASTKQKSFGSGKVKIVQQ